MSSVLNLGVTLPARAYPKLVNFLVPAFPEGAANLKGLYVFGGNPDLVLRNLVNDALPLLRKNAPVVNDIGVMVGGAGATPGHYDTQLIPTPARTTIAIAKPLIGSTSALSQMILSNFLASPLGGDSLNFNNSEFKTNGNHASTIRASNISIAAADAAKFNIFAGRIKDTGEVKGYWGHGGITTPSVESAAGTRAALSRSLLIGSDYSKTYTGSLQVQLVAEFDAALTDAQILANLAYLRTSYGPQLGMTDL